MLKAFFDTFRSNPRFEFVASFMWDLITIAVVVIGVRIIHLIIALLDNYIPDKPAPVDMASYLPFSVTNAIVTAMDTVSLISIAIIGIWSIIDLLRIILLRRQQATCPVSNCPYRQQHLTEQTKQD